jgi:hypothetical protein
MKNIFFSQTQKPHIIILRGKERKGIDPVQKKNKLTHASHLAVNYTRTNGKYLKLGDLHQ